MNITQRYIRCGVNCVGASDKFRITISESNRRCSTGWIKHGK